MIKQLVMIELILFINNNFIQYKFITTNLLYIYKNIMNKKE